MKRGCAAILFAGALALGAQDEWKGAKREGREADRRPRTDEATETPEARKDPREEWREWDREARETDEQVMQESLEAQRGWAKPGSKRSGDKNLSKAQQNWDKERRKSAKEARKAQEKAVKEWKKQNREREKAERAGQTQLR